MSLPLHPLAGGSLINWLKLLQANKGIDNQYLLKGFPLSDRSEVHSECSETTKNSATIKIPNLLPGTYAMSVVDDCNRDYQLNRNIFGIPQEGFGISNNPRVSAATGLPKFQDASFLLKVNQAVDIRMKYSLDS